MKYYRLVEDFSKKVTGTYPSFIPEESFGDIEPSKRINWKGSMILEDEEVEIPKLQLKRKTSKPTNLLPALSGGFGMCLIVDDKLKTILENAKTSHFRYFPTTLKMFNSNETLPYWFIKSIRPFYDIIDIGNCIFKEGGQNFSNPDNRKIRIFNNINELYISLSNKEIIVKYHPDFRNDVDIDFFAIDRINDSAVSFYVSEKLKEEIEKEKLTGMKFIAINERWP
jgi:hypothetical protein